MVYHLWGLGVSIDDVIMFTLKHPSIGDSSAATFDYRRVTTVHHLGWLESSKMVARNGTLQQLHHNLNTRTILCNIYIYIHMSIHISMIYCIYIYYDYYVLTYIYIQTDAIYTYIYIIDTYWCIHITFHDDLAIRWRLAKLGEVAIAVPTSLAYPRAQGLGYVITKRCHRIVAVDLNNKHWEFYGTKMVLNDQNWDFMGYNESEPMNPFWISGD